MPSTPSASSSAWQLSSPGGGGGISAIAVGPVIWNSFQYSTVGRIIVVGSDVGGYRISDDNGRTFHGMNRGLNFTSPNAKNIQAIEWIPNSNFLVSTSTDGSLNLGEIQTSPLSSSHWQTIYDFSPRTATGNRIPLGAIGVSADSRLTLVGVGNINRLMLNESPADQGLGDSAGKLLVVRDILTSTRSIGQLSLPALCNEDFTDQLVTSISSSSSAPALFWVGTTKGIYTLFFSESGLVNCKNRSGNLPVSARDIRGVQAMARAHWDVALVSHTQGVFVSNKATIDSPVWTAKNGSGTGALKLSGGYFGLYRSKNQSNQYFVLGHKQSEGMSCSQDGGTTWSLCFDPRAVTAGAFDGWVRKTGYSAGVTALDLREGSSDGIKQFFVAGGLGLFFRGDTSARGFDLTQSYTNLVLASSNPVMNVYSGNGLELQMPSALQVNPYNRNQIYQLYVDNLLFVSDDNGGTYRRPVSVWSRGTDAAFVSERLSYVSAMVGNDPQSAEGGAVYRSLDSGMTFQVIGGGDGVVGGLPNSPVTSLSLLNGELYAAVFGKGLFVFSPASGKWTQLGLDALGANGRYPFSLQRTTLSSGQVLLLLNSTSDKVSLHSFSGTSANLVRRELTLPSVSIKSNRLSGFKVIGSELYLFTKDGAYASAIQADGAGLSSWTPIPSLTGDQTGVVSDIELCYANSQYYYSTRGAGVYSLTRGDSPSNAKKLTTDGLDGYTGLGLLSLTSRRDCESLFSGTIGAYGFFKLTPLVQ